MAFDATEFRQIQRTMWGSAGDWPSMAQLIEPVSEDLVPKLEIDDGLTLLDVGTGNGNLAIRAAQAGAKVTGVDLAPELFDSARERAEEAGVEVEWVEGDAGDLPFDDDCFDRVASVFGAIFAPVNQNAADEMLRVCKPGGLIVNCAWTPEGMNGRMFIMLGSKMPPPPDEVQPPVLWGDEDHVRELYEGKDVDLSFDKTNVEIVAESAESLLDRMENELGPMVMAKKALEPEGKWDEVREEMLELDAEFGEQTDDGYVGQAEYLRAYIRPNA